MNHVLYKSYAPPKTNTNTKFDWLPKFWQQGAAEKFSYITVNNTALTISQQRPNLQSAILMIHKSFLHIHQVKSGTFLRRISLLSYTVHILCTSYCCLHPSLRSGRLGTDSRFKPVPGSRVLTGELTFIFWWWGNCDVDCVETKNKQACKLHTERTSRSQETNPGRQCKSLSSLFNINSLFKLFALQCLSTVRFLKFVHVKKRQTEKLLVTLVVCLF